MSISVPLTVSAWTLGGGSFDERVRRARRAGFEAIGLRASDYISALDQGWKDSDLTALLARLHMRVSEVECITGWAEQRRPFAQKATEQICFHMCRLFGVDRVNCALMEPHAPARIAQALAELCDRAGDLTVALEPMPYSALPTAQAAWQAIQSTGRDNACLILDAWHWIRAGQPLDPAALEGIDPRRICAIHINDVREHPYAPAVLRDESMHDRRMPGQGCGDTAGFVRLLHSYGAAPRLVSVEVMDDRASAAAGPEQWLSDNAQAARAVLEQSWPALLPAPTP